MKKIVAFTIVGLAGYIVGVYDTTYNFMKAMNDAAFGGHKK